VSKSAPLKLTLPNGKQMTLDPATALWRVSKYAVGVPLASLAGYLLFGWRGMAIVIVCRVASL